MKRVKLEPVKTIKGKPFRIPQMDAEDEDAPLKETTKLVDLLELLIFGIPRPKLTMKDSIEGGRLYEQLQGAKDGILALEDEEHKWAEKMVEEHAPQLFGVNATQIKDALDNFERKYEKKGTKEAPEAEAEEAEKD